MKKTLIICLSLLFLTLIFFVGCEQIQDKIFALSKGKQLELSEKCAKVGREYFKQFVAETNATAYQMKTSYSWDDPEFHYNKRLNTCLIHIRYIEREPYPIHYTTHYNQVVDVFSNKTILRGFFSRDKEDDSWKENILDMNDGVPNFTSTEYFKRKDKLFTE